MADIQAFFNAQYSRIQSNPNYLKIKAMPTTQRWVSIVGIFLISQMIIFGFLYLAFGGIVVIGFMASILAGLATGVGALPALFFKNISDNLFNSLLGATAGVMLAATAF